MVSTFIREKLIHHNHSVFWKEIILAGKSETVKSGPYLIFTNSIILLVTWIPSWQKGECSGCCYVERKGKHLRQNHQVNKYSYIFKYMFVSFLSLTFKTHIASVFSGSPCAICVIPRLCSVKCWVAYVNLNIFWWDKRKGIFILRTYFFIYWTNEARLWLELDYSLDSVNF